MIGNNRKMNVGGIQMKRKEKQTLAGCLAAVMLAITCTSVWAETPEVLDAITTSRVTDDNVIVTEDESSETLTDESLESSENNLIDEEKIEENIIGNQEIINGAEAASSIVHNATFVPRYDAPDKSNAYYYANNPFYQSGYGMPNCTAYAWGRAYELLGSKPKLSTGNAGKWWWYNKNNGYYSYGSTPKLGAIACWDDYDQNQGHVAVVEAISGDSITISESHWKGTNFDTRTIKANSSNYLTKKRFLGYIYIGSFDSAPVDPAPVDLGTDFYAYIINTTAGKHLTNDNPNVSMRSETGAANQVWKFDKHEDGTYKITNCQDGRV